MPGFSATSQFVMIILLGLVALIGLWGYEAVAETLHWWPVL